MGENRKTKSILESYEWIEVQLKKLQYGEIGISFVIHDGKIVKTVKKLEEKQQASYR